MAKLIILTEGMAGRALELGANKVTIGRTEDNTFQIFQPSVSSHHCEIFLRGDELIVKDLGSTNGTYIAGAKISEGVLRSGQSLGLGDVQLKFEAAPVAARPVHTASPARRNKKILWVGVAVAVLLLLAFVIYFAIRLLPSFGNPPGQIGWWKLDDGRGAVAKDSSPGGNNGKLIRAPKWVKGKDGGALQFNGSQRVLLGKIFQDSYDQISIACWIKHSSSGWQSIVERSVWDNPDGIGLWADYSGQGVTFGHYSAAQVKSQTTVQDDQWHHVVGTMAKSGDSYVYSVYVDGKLDNTMTNSEGMAATTNPWSIGERYDGSWGYTGLIDDVRIFDHALTASEVRKLYKQ
jgi:Concanavalin A-like lectin/glucanases superfamily/FHA domain